MSKPRLQPKGKGSLAGSLSTENVEELRSAHVRTLEAMGHLNRENTRLEAEVERLEKQTKGFERMKPEELDSLYVEERRLIESLERQNAELKAAAAGARGTRDAEVAKAKAECEQLRKQMEELRGHQRKAAQLAASQLEQIRTAYAQELADKASECEQLRTELEGLKLEMALERNRADGLERKLAELQSGSKLEDILAAEKAEMERTIAALRLELKSAVARADAAEDTALQSSERARNSRSLNCCCGPRRLPSKTGPRSRQASSCSRSSSPAFSSLKPWSPPGPQLMTPRQQRQAIKSSRQT